MEKTEQISYGHSATWSRNCQSKCDGAKSWTLAWAERRYTFKQAHWNEHCVIVMKQILPHVLYLFSCCAACHSNGCNLIPEWRGTPPLYTASLGKMHTVISARLSIATCVLKGWCRRVLTMDYLISNKIARSDTCRLRRKESAARLRAMDLGKYSLCEDMFCSFCISKVYNHF